MTNHLRAYQCGGRECTRWHNNNRDDDSDGADDLSTRKKEAVQREQTSNGVIKTNQRAIMQTTGRFSSFFNRRHWQKYTLIDNTLFADTCVEKFFCFQRARFRVQYVRITMPEKPSFNFNTFTCSTFEGNVQMVALLLLLTAHKVHYIYHRTVFCLHTIYTLL